MRDHAQEGTPGPTQEKRPRRKRMIWCDTVKTFMPEDKCRGNCGTRDCAAYKDILKRMDARERKATGRFRVPAVPVEKIESEASHGPTESMRTRAKDRGDKARFRLKEE